MAAAFIILALYLFCVIAIYLLCRKQGLLSWQQVMLFFGGKIAAGWLYGYVFSKVYGGDDTWALNHDASLQYERLMQSPLQFFSDLFSSQPVYNNHELLFRPVTYLESLEYSIVTKTLAPFNFISHGNYYINIIFFNFLAFWGAYLLYKMLVQQFNSNRKILAAAIFLFPPAAFWLSGIRAEGFLLLLTGILLYHFSKWISSKHIIHLVWCLLSFILLFILRNGYAMLFLPALASWWLSVRHNMKAGRVFIIFYISMIVLVVAGSYWLPGSVNPLSIAAKRQHEFLLLNGNTRYNLTALEPTPTSFIKVLPEAFINVFIRPFLWEAKGFLQWFVALENIALIGMILFAVIKFPARIKQLFNHPLAWALLLTAITNYLFIGFVVPFAGGIVRYRIIPELFLLAMSAMVVRRETADVRKQSAVSSRES
jgi:hypothetical protein